MVRSNIIACLLIVWMVGCSSQTSQESQPNKVVEIPTVQVLKQEKVTASLNDLKPAGINSAAAKTSVGDTDFEQIQEDVVNRRRNYLFLQFWRSDSPACQRSIPAMIQLNQDFSKQMDVMLVSLDADGGNPDQVSAMMKKQKITFSARILEKNDIQKTVKWLDNNWNGQLPVTFFFNPEGKLLHEFKGAQTLDEYKSIIQKQLQ